MYFNTFFTLPLLSTVASLIVRSTDYSSHDLCTPNRNDYLSLMDIANKYFPEESEDIRFRLQCRFSYAHGCNMQRVKTRLYHYIEWREAENIDSVLEENWNDMDELYPYRKSIYTDPESDYRGLVLSIDIGKWDIRVAASSTEAERKRFVRFVSAKMMEDVNKDNHPGAVVGGRTASYVLFKYDVVINMKDYDLEKHACPQCTRLLMEIMMEVGNHWSEAIRRIYLANAPDFSPYIRSRIEEFQTRSKIPVEILPGQVLKSHPKNDKVYSVVVFRDWVWTIEE